MALDMAFQVQAYLGHDIIIPLKLKGIGLLHHTISLFLKNPYLCLLDVVAKRIPK